MRVGVKIPVGVQIQVKDEMANNNDSSAKSHHDTKSQQNEGREVDHSSSNRGGMVCCVDSCMNSCVDRWQIVVVSSFFYPVRHDSKQ